MKVQAKARHVRQSPYKVRRVLDLVRGLPVDDARVVLKHTPRRAAGRLRLLVVRCWLSEIVSKAFRVPLLACPAVHSTGVLARADKPPLAPVGILKLLLVAGARWHATSGGSQLATCNAQLPTRDFIFLISDFRLYVIIVHSFPSNAPA